MIGRGCGFVNRLQDEELVVLCLQGNRDAYAELVKRYERQIYSLAYRLTNNYHDAVELSQEVFLHLYRVLDKFDGDRKFFPWMYRIATNVCYNSLKKKPKESTSLDQVMEFVSDDESQPEVTYEKKEIQETVQKAIAELPENYRIPMVLKYIPPPQKAAKGDHRKIWCVRPYPLRQDATNAVHLPRHIDERRGEEFAFSPTPDRYKSNSTHPAADP